MINFLHDFDVFTVDTNMAINSLQSDSKFFNGTVFDIFLFVAMIDFLLLYSVS